MFRTATGVAAALASFLLVSPAAVAGDGCHPLEGTLTNIDDLPGRKAWIWADSQMEMRMDRKAFGMAPTWKQIGPDSWAKGEEGVPYGEPVTIVRHDEWPGSSGRTTVRTEDGRTYIVPGSTVKLYEFWKCSVTDLLTTRWITDTKTRMRAPRSWAGSVWVRLVDKTVPVEMFQTWMKPDDVAKIDLMLCNTYQPADQHKDTKTYPLQCQPYTARGAMPGVSLDPKAVEVVSPTSMKIMLTN
jgi:hypothetical protein